MKIYGTILVNERKYKLATIPAHMEFNWREYHDVYQINFIYLIKKINKSNTLGFMWSFVIDCVRKWNHYYYKIRTRSWHLDHLAYSFTVREGSGTEPSPKETNNLIFPEKIISRGKTDGYHMEKSSQGNWPRRKRRKKKKKVFGDTI